MIGLFMLTFWSLFCRIMWEKTPSTKRLVLVALNALTPYWSREPRQSKSYLTCSEVVQSNCISLSVLLIYAISPLVFYLGRAPSTLKSFIVFLKHLELLLLHHCEASGFFRSSWRESLSHLYKEKLATHYMDYCKAALPKTF